jgi:SulP family sulfate permease
VLAAVIIVAVMGLLNFKSFIKAWQASRDDGLSAIITFATTLVFAPNIQNGIITGIILSLALLLYRMMQPHVAGLGMHSDGTLRDARRHNLPPLHPQLGAIRFDGALRFMNVSYFEDALLTLERKTPSLRYILVKCDGINYLDASGVEMLFSLVSRFQNNGITLGFSGLKRQVHEVMEKTGLTEAIGAENIFSNDHIAFESLYARKVIDTPIKTHARHLQDAQQHSPQEFSNSTHLQ